MTSERAVSESKLQSFKKHDNEGKERASGGRGKGRRMLSRKIKGTKEGGGRRGRSTDEAGGEDKDRAQGGGKEAGKNLYFLASVFSVQGNPRSWRPRGWEGH